MILSQWIDFCDYHSNDFLLGVCICLLCLLLFSIERRRRKREESLYLLHTLLDIYKISKKDRLIIARILRYVPMEYPHVFVSSIAYFEEYFKRMMIAVDKSRKLFPVKGDLLRMYSAIRQKLVESEYPVNEQRGMPRFIDVAALFLKQKHGEMLQEGLLLNVSGGGVKFITRSRIKKGAKVKLSFHNNFFSSVTARVLDVAERADVFLVRARYAYIYPGIC